MGHMKLITRAAARIKKIPHYFTGLPCLNGHIDRRYVSTKRCMECARIKSLNYYHSLSGERKAHREKATRERNWRYKGIPSPPYPAPLLCECCGRSETGRRKALSLDHDHNAGIFRGWLCNNCNRGIGYLGDTLEGVKLAVVFLEKRAHSIGS